MHDGLLDSALVVILLVFRSLCSVLRQHGHGHSHLLPKKRESLPSPVESVRMTKMPPVTTAEGHNSVEPVVTSETEEVKITGRS